MKELCKAMAQAFPAIEGAIKDKTNPHFRSKYADLTNVIAAIKPELSSNGLWFTQVVHSAEGMAAVETIIMHTSGESLSCGVTSVPVLKNDAQGYGSALTYARRYSLSAAFGVAPEDDDGNEACEKPKVPPAVGPNIPVQAYPKLTPTQIENLSKKATETVGGVIPAGEMLEFLTDWQAKDKASIQPIVGSLLTTNTQALINGFNKWKGNRAA